MKTITVIVVLSVLFSVFLLILSRSNDHSEYEAKLSFIRSGLDLYYKEHHVYPRVLRELISDGVVNRLPKLPDSSDFIYEVVRTDGKALDYTLR